MRVVVILLSIPAEKLLNIHRYPLGRQPTFGELVVQLHLPLEGEDHLADVIFL